MANYCWSLKREITDHNHKKNTPRTNFIKKVKVFTQNNSIGLIVMDILY